jgi:hypothetical protein
MYWSAITRGFQPKGDQREGIAKLQRGTDGVHLDLADDTDGYAVQNGGLYNPQPEHLQVGQYYYRFFGSVSRNRFGVDSCLTGGWWFGHETYLEIRNFAQRLGWPLGRAGAHLLIVPKEWQDCAWLGQAILELPMKAFAGKGKPATHNISPDSALRRETAASISIGAPHLQIKQYFVPGGAATIGRAFKKVSVVRTIKTESGLDF